MVWTVQQNLEPENLRVMFRDALCPDLIKHLRENLHQKPSSSKGEGHALSATLQTNDAGTTPRVFPTTT